MAPVGLFTGAANGASEAAKLSDNPAIQAGSAIIGSVTGAASGAVSLPMETSTELTQKAIHNGYLV